MDSDTLLQRAVLLGHRLPVPGVVQRAITENKKNNTAATRSALRTHRRAEGHWTWTGCQKNFAIDMDDTNTYGFSDAGGHSERNLLLEMWAGGRNVGDDVKIHTERETCGSCWSFLEQLHDKHDGTASAFDIDISYTVDYDDDAQDNLHAYYRSKPQTNDMPPKGG